MDATTCSNSGNLTIAATPPLGNNSGTSYSSLKMSAYHISPTWRIHSEHTSLFAGRKCDFDTANLSSFIPKSFEVHGKMPTCLYQDDKPGTERHPDELTSPTAYSIAHNSAPLPALSPPSEIRSSERQYAASA